MSHSHHDARWVESLATRLEDEKSLRIWLDKWILVPGEPWQRHMALGLRQARSCVVVVGDKTPAGWFQEEVEKALDRQVNDEKFRVIPVIAPGGKPENLPDFVALRTWSDFRDPKDEEYALHLLSQGIRGLPIGRWPPQDSAKESRFKAKLVELQHMSVHLEREVYIETQRNLMNKWLKDL